jgi:hypothetical protein
VAAFEKAKAAREANLRKKFEAETAEKKQKAEESQPEPESESENVQPKSEQEATKPMEIVPQDDEKDYIDFDPDAFRNELYEKLGAARTEIDKLKKHVHGVSSKLDELQTSFQKHNVRAANMLNFV